MRSQNSLLRTPRPKQVFFWLLSACHECVYAAAILCPMCNLQFSSFGFMRCLKIVSKIFMNHNKINSQFWNCDRQKLGCTLKKHFGHYFGYSLYKYVLMKHFVKKQKIFVPIVPVSGTKMAGIEGCCNNKRQQKYGRRNAWICHIFNYTASKEAWLGVDHSI